MKPVPRSNDRVASAVDQPSPISPVRRAQLVVERPEDVRMQSTVTLQVAGGLPVRVELRPRIEGAKT
jgi:hypothetical protein